MNNEIMSVIFASDNEAKLNELTIHRTIASLPFGARYRLIDFALSNLVNSNITTIGIITRSNYLSLMDHIRMGRDWDLNRKNSGIVVFPPYVSNTNRNIYKGKIEALYGIVDYLENTKEEYILISNSNVVSSIDFDDVYDFHLKNNADITMLSYQGVASTSKRIIISKETDNRVEEVLIFPSVNETTQYMGVNMYLIKKDLLIKIISDAYARGYVDFEQYILQHKINEYKVCNYKLQGFTAIVDDIKSYYNVSMQLLNNDIRNDLFYRCGKVFTKVKDSVPTTYKGNCKIKNSLIADGCVINGTVENSILFRGVIVEEGAEIKNSIVMENTYIMKNATLHYAITDKNVVVKEERNISGYDTYPVVIVKGKLI